MGTGQETVLSSQSRLLYHAKQSEKKEEKEGVAKRRRPKENLLLKLGRVRVQTPRPPVNERENKLWNSITDRGIGTNQVKELPLQRLSRVKAGLKKEKNLWIGERRGRRGSILMESAKITRVIILDEITSP